MIIHQGEVNGIVEAREYCFICLSHSHSHSLSLSHSLSHSHTPRTHAHTHARTLLLEIPKRLRMEDGNHVSNRKLNNAQNAS